MQSKVMSPALKPIDILLVEDDKGDVLLTKKALANGKLANTLTVAKDGLEAMSILRQQGDYADAPRPDLILLDLNMPRMDGAEVLAAIKADQDLRSIPVVILTTSDSHQDVLKSYDGQASCYITKPVDFDQFMGVVQAINDFYFAIVKLPTR